MTWSFWWFAVNCNFFACSLLTGMFDHFCLPGAQDWASWMFTIFVLLPGQGVCRTCKDTCLDVTPKHIPNQRLKVVELKLPKAKSINMLKHSTGMRCTCVGSLPCSEGCQITTVVIYIIVCHILALWPCHVLPFVGRQSFWALFSSVFVLIDVYAVLFEVTCVLDHS